MVFVLSLLVVLFGLGVLVACTLGGVWNLMAALRPSAPARRRVGRGAAMLAAAAALTAVPWIAAPIAESSTGWVDADGDGMLDPMVNGGYDWVDINGEVWASVASAMVVAIALGLAFASAALRPRQGTAASRGDAVGVAG